MSPASASAEKTERLLNLILALKSARRPVSKQRIRESLPAYAAATSDEAFDRMFERDKDELREMGIPITTTVLDVLFDDEVGYRIDSSETTLPAISFEPDEVAALALAARAWSTASISGAASAGLRKLRLSGVEIDESVAAGAEPRIRTKEPAFEAVHAALSALQPITFDYRKNDGELTTRQVQPWALKNWHGRWYLTGYDLDRGDDRAFRLSRFEGPSVARAGRARTPSRPTTCPRWPSRHSRPSLWARPSCGCATGAATPCAATPSGDRARRALVRDRGALLPRHDRARRRRPGPARRRRLAARARRRRALGARRWPGHRVTGGRAAATPGTPTRHRHERSAVGAPAPRDGDPAARPPARHGAVAAPAPRRADRGGRARVRGRRGPDRRGPRAALRLRHTGLRPRRAHRRPVGQRPHLPRQRRRHRRPDAPDPRRGGHPDGRTAGPGLDAGRLRRRRAHARQDPRGGGDDRRRADGSHRPRPRRRQPAPGHGDAQGRLRSQPAGAPALLRRHAGRVDRARRRHHAHPQPRRAVVRRGLLPPRRRTSGSSGSTASRTSPCSMSTARPRGRRVPATSTTCSSPARTTSPSSSRQVAGRPGSRTTTPTRGSSVGPTGRCG